MPAPYGYEPLTAAPAGLASGAPSPAHAGPPRKADGNSEFATQPQASSHPIPVPEFAASTLADIEPGRRVIVRRVTACGAISRRILDMGISRGAVIEVERRAPLADPLLLKVRGYTLALRRREAALIEVGDCNEVSAAAQAIPLLD